LSWEAYQRIAENVSRTPGTVEPEDVAQEVFLALWTTQPHNEPLAYTIAFRARSTYWRWLQYRLDHPSLDAHVTKTLTLADTIEGDNGATAENVAMLAELARTNPAIVTIGRKKEDGFPLTKPEQKRLERFRVAAAVA